MTKAKFTQSLGIAFRVLMGLLFCSPVFLGLIFSFVPNEYLDNLPTIGTIVSNLTLENYRWVFKNIPLLLFVANSLFMCFVAIIAQIITASLAAYAFAFLEYPGKNAMFYMVIVALMIPGQVTIIANFLNVQRLGLVNTHLGLVLPYLVSGVATFMIRQHFLTIPRELKDASVIDGCSDMRFLTSIAMPLATPTLAALAIYRFIDVYNYYLWPMLISQGRKTQTVQIGMSMLVQADATQYGRILAGAMISIFIPVIVFLFGQDYIVKGMTSGAVKG